MLIRLVSLSSVTHISLRGQLVNHLTALIHLKHPQLQTFCRPLTCKVHTHDVGATIAYDVSHALYDANYNDVLQQWSTLWS